MVYAANVVDEDVDRVVLLDGVRDEPGGGAGIGEVERDAGHALEPVERVRGARAGDDVRAFVGRRARYRQLAFAGNKLVIGRNAETVASTRPGTILVVNPASGGIAGSLRTPAEVVDLLALG